MRQQLSPRQLYQQAFILPLFNLNLARVQARTARGKTPHRGPGQSSGETKIDLYAINDAKVQNYCPSMQLSGSMFFPFDRRLT